MWVSPEVIRWEQVQILDENGQLVGQVPDLTNEQMLEMYRNMVFARLFDERAVRLQRQGRIGTYAPYSGQEGAQVGSAFAFKRSDWVFASYRDLPVLWIHGVPLDKVLAYSTGRVRGGFIPEDVCAFPAQIIIGSQTLHAIGGGWASQYLKDGSISVCYLGDGATSQGDFHEALNFASVYKLPVVFVVQNNQWAISVPRSRQSAGLTLAQKGIAFGIPGIQVDGNDVLAVYQVMLEAVTRARSGEGPSLIEAITYRQGPHTTSDDPTRYRDLDELQSWLIKDPIRRFKRFLYASELWDDRQEEAMLREANDQIRQVVATIDTADKGTLAEMAELVYATTPDYLRKQVKQADIAKGL